MEKKFFLVESSRWSSDGTVNPVVHAVIYATKDSLAIRMLDFLQKHVELVMDRDCESLDVRYLTGSHVDARLVQAFRTICDSASDDISFDCPEWKESYRIRSIAINENYWRSQHMSPNQKVVLGVEFKNIQEDDACDFMTTDLTLRPEHRLPGAAQETDPLRGEMFLDLNSFSTEGLEW